MHSKILCEPWDLFSFNSAFSHSLVIIAQLQYITDTVIEISTNTLDSLFNTILKLIQPWKLACQWFLWYGIGVT